MEKMFVFPPIEKPQQFIPESTQKAMAFYAAASYGENPVEDYKNALADISTEGSSQLIESAKQRWEQEQDGGAKEAIKGLVADPTVHPDVKQAALSSYVSGGFVSRNLRDKYKEKVAARDTSITEADKRAQDAWITTMQDRDNKATELQGRIDAFGASLSDNPYEAVAGVSRDVLPVASLAWNYNVKRVAEAVGVDKWYDILLPGSANRRIKDKFNSLPVEERIKFVDTVVEAYKDTPSFDINNWLDFKVQIEDPREADWMVSLDNIAGVLNWVGLGFLARLPRKAIPTLTEVAGPRVNPLSPAGTTATVNPPEASKLGAAAVVDPSGTVADAMGTNKGSIINDWMLPKLSNELGTVYPNIARDLELLDKQMQGVFNQTKFDPSLLPVTKMENDVAVVNSVIKEVNGAHFQQANSIGEQTSRQFNGIATFGRNENHGFETIAEAEEAVERIQDAIMSHSGGTRGQVGVVPHDGQFYAQWTFKREYDPFEALTLGTQARFLGMDASGIARTKLGKWLFPNTMRMPTWIPKSAAQAELMSARVEAEFIKEIRTNIASSKNRQELFDIVRETEETGVYLTPAQVSSRFPDLSQKQVKELYRNYMYTKRMADYSYNWVNRHQRNALIGKGYQGIYLAGSDNVWFGTTKFPKEGLDKVKLVYDFEAGIPIARPADDVLYGRELVRLHKPIETDQGILEYGIAGPKISIGPLPNQVVNQIPGYIPRVNLESWYVVRTPKSLTINGNKVTDPDVLRNYSQVIGAGASAKQAKALENRFATEFPDSTITSRPQRENVGDTVTLEYEARETAINYSKQRGERLPTVDGEARIEDPLIALVENIKLASRVGAWDTYREAFQTKFVQQYGKWTNYKFPDSAAGFVPKKNMTKEEARSFQDAQRMFEQYSEFNYKASWGDRVWDDLFWSIGEVLEKLPLPQAIQEGFKAVGKSGNLLYRIPKTLASHLFLYASPLRQWWTQPQQLTELMALNPQWGARDAINVPSVVSAVLARAKGVEEYRAALHALAHKTSFISKQEFDDVVEAIYSKGIPQAVDLNSTLHGTFQDVERALVESFPRKTWERAKTVVGTPTSVGKAVGYAPAELTNQVGLFMFAKFRWQQANPGVKWNTPENIAVITGDMWDIGHSMATTAGTFPYQKGFLSLPMQFSAVTHKAFMQLFSSQTLSAAERAKLAGVRAAFYGMYGVPGAYFIDQAIQKYADEDTQVNWNHIKRGLFDWSMNNTLNAMLDEKGTDIALSQSSTPMPVGLPYWELYHQLSRIGEPNGTRFPFMQATATVFEAVRDISALRQTKELDTPDALKKAFMEAVELASGYNNYAKAMMIRNYGDKMSKLGDKMGLELNRAEMIAQLFGIITQEELVQYEIRDSEKKRKEYIEQSAREIHDQLMKMRSKFGEEDFSKYKSRLQSLNTFVDPELLDEVNSRVMQLDRNSLLTRSESILIDIVKHHQDTNDRFTTAAIAKLRALENPRAREFLNMLRDEGVTE